MSLDSNNRSWLRQFLIERFSLDELRDLAFDIGVDFELFSHNNNKTVFCRELIAYLERRDKLSCLIREIVKVRNVRKLTQLLSKLRPCIRSEKVQVIIPRNKLANASANLDQLAAILQVEINEIAFIAMVSGSMRLLLELPESAINFHALLESHYASGDEYPLISIVQFNMLSRERQLAWRMVAYNSPPLLEANVLQPTISWQNALELVKRLEAGTDYKTSRIAIESRVSEGDGPVEVSVPVPPPIFNLNAEPDQRSSPIPAHKNVNDRYVWYTVEKYDEDFLPDIGKGVWLLVNTETAEHEFRQDELIVVVRSDDTEGSIVLKPRTPGEHFQRIFLGSARFEGKFTRNMDTGEVALSPHMEQRVNPDDIVGTVAGIWLPLPRLID